MATRRERLASEAQARRSPHPHIHRVPRMPHRYKREPADRIGHDPLAQAVVLPWVPDLCPKCGSGCLRDRGLEVGCGLCGWEQVVRR